MHLVGFTIEIYHDAQPYRRQTGINIVLHLVLSRQGTGTS